MTTKKQRHLRIVEPSAPEAFTYQNRRGDRYYLHQGRTKTGKQRFFFARTVREGAIVRMPDGYEVTENINGVVSVRRKKEGEASLPTADVEIVRKAVDRHTHLRWYKVQTAGLAIVIYEPSTSADDLRRLSDHFVFPSQIERFIEREMERARYAPIMKFEQEGKRYVAYRMTYRGEGGWSWPLATGALSEMVTKLVPSIGTEKFFELL